MYDNVAYEEKYIEIMNSKKFPISGVNEFVKNNFVSGFTDNAVRRPLEEVLNTVLPYNSGLYHKVRSRIKDTFGIKSMNVNAIKAISDAVTISSMSQHEFLDYDEGVELVRKFPRELQEYINENPGIRQNKFVSLLTFDKAEKGGSPFDTITIDTIGKMDASQEADTAADFEVLYENPDTKDLAIKLLKYSYATKGMSFGMGSFSKLIPVSAKTDMMIDEANGSMVDLLRNVGNHDNDVDDIIFEQIIRNNYYDTNIVPKMSKRAAEKSVFIQEDGTVIIKINPNRATHKKFTVKDGEDIVPVGFFSYMHNGELKLMESQGAVDNDGNFIFKETFTLGIKGKAVEYDANRRLTESAFEVEKSKNFDPEDTGLVATTIKGGKRQDKTVLDVDTAASGLASFEEGMAALFKSEGARITDYKVPEDVDKVVPKGYENVSKDDLSHAISDKSNAEMEAAFEDKRFNQMTQEQMTEYEQSLILAERLLSNMSNVD